jgi:trehalose-phosphatase
LRAAGADLVTSDLRGLLHNGAPRTLATLPSAWDRRFELEAKAKDRPIAVFLDYDGTLTPIVEDHRAANLSEEMRSALVRLSERHSVAVVSGRDLTDVRGRVDLRNLFYAGSHGFDIAGPGGIAERPSQAERLLGLIDDVEAELRAAIGEVAGAEAERKRFSVAVHYRRVAEADVAALEAAVERVADRHAELGKSRGKKVIEIQPRVAWDKGRAVGWLLDHTPLGAGDPLVLYLGDDLTDEDAFDALGDRGFGIALRGGARLTLADWALEDIDDVGSFLDWLADLATGARA